MAKPLEERKYIAFLKLIGWSLKKSGFDYNLCDENDKYLCTIKILHGKGKKERFLPQVFVRQNKNLKKEDGHGHQKRNK